MRSMTPLRREFLLIHHPMYQVTLWGARILSSNRLMTLPRSHTPVRGSWHKGRQTGMAPTAVASAGMRSSPCRLNNAPRVWIFILGSSSLQRTTRNLSEVQDVYVGQHIPPSF